MDRRPRNLPDLKLTDDLQPGAVTAPLGFHPCSVDAKSRLKIPAAYLKYMATLGKQFFITSSDALDVQIYTRDAFVKQCEFLEGLLTDADLAEEAEDTLFLMKHLGDDVTPDTDGRVHLPPVLRQRLGINELPASCQMGIDRDHFVVLTAERYEAKVAKSQVSPAAAAKRLRLAGMR